MMVGRSGVLAFDVKDICFGPQRDGFGFFAFEFLGNSNGSVGKMEGARHIHSYLLYYFCGEFGDYFGFQQRTVLLEKLLPAGIVGKTRQFLQQLLAIRLASPLCFLFFFWGGMHGTPFFSKLLALFLQATAANEADRSGGDAKLFRDFLIGARWVIEKKHAHHSAAAGRQRRQGLANTLLALHLIEHFLGKFIATSPGAGVALVFSTAVEDFQVVDQIQPIFFRAQTFVKTSLHQPLGKSPRFAQFRQAGKQVDAYRLKNVSRIFPGQAELDGDRENQILVFFNQRRPCDLVTLATFANQTLIGPCHFAGRGDDLHCFAPDGGPVPPKKYSSSTFQSVVGSRIAGLKFARLFFAPTRMSGVARNTYGRFAVMTSCTWS